jgi:hypothetical protein
MADIDFVPRPRLRGGGKRHLGMSHITQVVNLITCIGLSVEFTAHVCISMFKLRGTQD